MYLHTNQQIQDLLINNKLITNKMQDVTYY
jgi:hypothetical protein